MAANGFMIYFDRLPYMGELTDEERGQLFMAMIAYAQDHEETRFEDRLVRTVYKQLCAMVDHSNDYMRDLSEKRSKARKSKLEQNQQTPTNDNKTEQNQQTLTKSTKSNKTDITNTNTNTNPSTIPNTNTNPNHTGEQVPIVRSVVELYNSTCTSLPRVTAISKKREDAIKARLRQYTLDDFKTMFKKAQASSFLKGANKRDWSATFDWLISDANMAKVLDGNYDDRAPASKDGIVYYMAEDTTTPEYERKRINGERYLKCKAAYEAGEASQEEFDIVSALLGEEISEAEYLAKLGDKYG